MLLLLANNVSGQQVYLIDSLKYEGGTKAERLQYKEDLQQYIRKAQTTAADSAHRTEWSVALWAMELLLDTSRSTVTSLQKPLSNYFKLNRSFKRALLETVYAVAPHQYAQRMFEIGMTETELKHVLMCRQYIRRLGTPYKDRLSELDGRLQRTMKPDPSLMMAYEKSKEIEKTGFLQPAVLKQLFNKNFLKGETVIFSIQRRNREYEGLAIVRKPDGTFIKEKNGRFFSVPQLARSISNLPWYLTNGNTPQGIYSIQGLDTSQSDLIGQTTNIQLVMPHEVSPAIFFHDSSNNYEWSESLLVSRLPSSLKNYIPLLASYYAGKAGRTEIISHGTTVDPSYYNKRSFYPNTPTQGCLCCVELYSEADGRCTMSNQLKLVNAFVSTGREKGYLVVIDVDDMRSMVNVNELTQYISFGK